MNERQKKGGLPNLGRLEDVADYLLDPAAAGGGFTSGSESEVETDAEVEILETATRKVLNKKQLQAYRSSESKIPRKEGPGVEKRAVKLVELGPRMKLRMTKVEEGVCGGKVMWHEFLSKTKEEVKEMERVWEKRRTEKEERKRVQKENVERKRKEKGEGTKDDKVVDKDMDDDEWDSEELEDNDDGEDEMDIAGNGNLTVVRG